MISAGVMYGSVSAMDPTAAHNIAEGAPKALGEMPTPLVLHARRDDCWFTLALVGRGFDGSPRYVIERVVPIIDGTIEREGC